MASEGAADISFGQIGQSLARCLYVVSVLRNYHSSRSGVILCEITAALF